MLVDPDVGHAGVVDTASPQQHQEETTKTQDCALVARLLDIPPKDVSWHERGPRSGSHRSHYYRVEIEAPDSAGNVVRLSLILTQDLQQVFGSVPPPMAATAGDMMELLRQHNLHGIESSGLARMIEGSSRARSARYWVRIAKGSAVDGLCGTHLLSNYLARTEGDAVDTLHQALATQSHLAVVEQTYEVRATFVHPDQALVLDVSCQPTDVFGRQVNRPSVRPSPGVALVKTAQRQKLMAEEYGYLYLVSCQEDGGAFLKLGIRSPIEIGTGKLHADFLCLPSRDRSNHPSAMDVQRIVAAHGVCCGIDPAACTRVSAALGDPQASAQLETVARGRRPEHGRDGFVTRADGDRAPAPASLLDPVWPTGMSVSEGSVLAVLDAATTGEPGYTVMGDRLDATAGKPVSLTAGNNVEVELLHGAKSLFRSSAEGFLVFWDHTVEVIELQ